MNLTELVNFIVPIIAIIVTLLFIASRRKKKVKISKNVLMLHSTSIDGFKIKDEKASKINHESMKGTRKTWLKDAHSFRANNDIRLAKGDEVFFVKEGFPQTIDLHEIINPEDVTFETDNPFAKAKTNSTVTVGSGKDAVTINIDEDVLGKATNESVLASLITAVDIPLMRKLILMASGIGMYFVLKMILVAVFKVDIPF